MNLDYRCLNCNTYRNAEDMTSMVCDCGGDFRPDWITADQSSRTFEPYYDRTLRSWVSSERDKEKKMSKFRSSGHPDGLYNVRDDKKFMREMAYIQKNREEYKAQIQPGYKPRTQREIEKQGERAYVADRPDRDSFRKRVYSFR